MSTLTLRVPPSLLEMIEPREENARMPGYSRKRALKAAISASISAGRLGSAITRRLRELTFRFRRRERGERASRRGRTDPGSSSSSGANSAFSVAAMRCISARL